MYKAWGLYKKEAPVICKTCGLAIPDNLVSCPKCVIKANDAALRQFQFDPLLKIAKRQGHLICHPSKSGNHVQMFGADVAFCGEPVSAPKHKRRYIELDDLKNVCTKCRVELSAILGEARDRRVVEIR